MVDDWDSFIAATTSVRGKAWCNKHQAEIDALEKHPDWDWKCGKKRTFIYMGAPRLVFSPSVKKENLQDGKGWLSKRFLSTGVP